jgi:hypothetical protein
MARPSLTLLATIPCNDLPFKPRPETCNNCCQFTTQGAYGRKCSVAPLGETGVWTRKGGQLRYERILSAEKLQIDVKNRRRVHSHPSWDELQPQIFVGRTTA